VLAHVSSIRFVSCLVDTSRQSSRSQRGDIPRATNRLNLTGKNLIITVIIADGGQNGSIGRQRNGRESPALEDEPATWQFMQHWPTPQHRLALAVRRDGNDLPVRIREVVPPIR